MIPVRKVALVLALAVLVPVVASAGNNSDKPPKLTDEGRKTLLRNLTAELVFTRKYFPMGKYGIVIKDGVVSPSDAEIRQITADNGPAAKPGDRVKITAVIFKKDAILFEINGGPVKKKKWYDRVQVSSVGGGTTPTNPTDKDPDNVYINARGSLVVLAFKDYVPQISTDEVKQMLEPVFDWKANSVAEAYTKAMPPQIQQAVKEHKALVGMDHEMVIYSKGRPPKKHREHDVASNTDYEEWIYGEPPQEVEFVRFQGDRVVRIETMRVDGEKIVRTKPEIDLDTQVSTMAKKEDVKKETEEKGPTLLRDGEKPAISERRSTPAPAMGGKKDGPAQPRTDGPPGGDTTMPDATVGPTIPPR